MMNFRRLEEMMNRFNKEVNESIEENVLENMQSEERLEQIQEYEEMLLAIYDFMRKVLEAKQEVEKVEAKYQKEKAEKTKIMDKIKGMFNKEERIDDKDALVSNAQIEYTVKENELLQLSYDISAKINGLRMKVNRTELEEYELASLMSQLDQINDILS